MTNNTRDENRGTGPDARPPARLAGVRSLLSSQFSIAPITQRALTNSSPPTLAPPSKMVPASV